MLDNTGSSRQQAPGRAGKKEWVGPSNRDGMWGTKTRETGTGTGEKPPNANIHYSEYPRSLTKREEGAQPQGL